VRLRLAFNQEEKGDVRMKMTPWISSKHSSKPPISLPQMQQQTSKFFNDEKMGLLTRIGIYVIS
jgi:hypothetical protein